MPEDEVREDDIILAIVREQGWSEQRGGPIPDLWRSGTNSSPAPHHMTTASHTCILALLLLPLFFPSLCRVSPVPASVKSISDLDAGLFFHTAAVCLSVYHAARADGQVAYPTKLPGGKAAQFRIGTRMAEDVKEMGYTKEVGYESFLYPSEASMKHLLRFLVDKLPKPEHEGDLAEADSQPSGGMVEVKNVLRAWTKHARTPLATVRHQVPINTVRLSTPNLDSTSRDALAYYQAAQPLVSSQARSFASLVPSLLNAHSLELVRKEADLVDGFDRKQRNAAGVARIQGLVRGAFGAALRARESWLASNRGADLSLFAAQDGSGRSAFGRRNYFENDAPTNVAAVAAPTAAPVAGESAEEREAALRAEREAQLAELQAQLDEALNAQRADDARTELALTQTRQLENQLANLVTSSRDLEDAYLVKKRTLDLLPDAANNLAELQRLVAASSTRLAELAAEWESHRAPLVARLRRAKQLYHERKEEIGVKVDAIKRLREEMKEKANDLREKEKLAKVLLEELNALPKSINRQVYVKRIMDLMKNIDKQTAQIKAVLADVRQVQKDINLTSESSQRSFVVADEVVFHSAKKNPKDEVMMKTYKYVVQLREGFVDLVAGVETKGKLENEILSLQTQMDDIETRNSNLNMDRIEADLAQVKKENKELAAAIKAASK